MGRQCHNDKQPASPIPSYVVLVYADGEITDCATFPKTPGGKLGAQQRFRKAVEEHVGFSYAKNTAFDVALKEGHFIDDLELWDAYIRETE